MPKVSIIVPVYKTEKYLQRCMDSILTQTLQDIEVILVDDGSPDNCGQLCDAFAERDNRIRVVHKKNGGLSSARNAGLAEAQGTYVGFVDSDDDVEPDMYEKMLQAAEAYQVDFVMADYRRIERDGTSFVKTLDIDGGYYDREKIVRDIFPNLIMRESIEYGPLLSVCHCFYRKDFLDQHRLSFDEEVRWSEDNIFSAILGYYCQSFFYMKGEALYHYYQNAESITTSYRNGAWDVYSVMNAHLHRIFDTVQDYDFSRQLKLHMIYYACNCIGQEIPRPPQEARKRIGDILNSSQLRAAFQDFPMPSVPFKLRVQLYLMKIRQTSLLYALKRR